MKLTYTILFFALSIHVLTAQEDPMKYQRWNTFDINNVWTMFNNTGLLCDGNQQNFTLARKPAFEYPPNSGKNYGSSVGVAVGAPIDQLPGAVGAYPKEEGYNYFCDATMDEGSAAYWAEEHFAPFKDFVGASGACMSDDPGSWPGTWQQFYPNSEDTLYIGSEGWPGFGKNGERIADQESFSVMYAWEGTDITTNPFWLKTQMVCRGLAWVGSLYEDFIVWIYVIRNIGTDPITDMRVAIHSDFGFMPEANNISAYDDDRHYYDPNLQFAYGWDDNSYEELLDGRTLGANDIAWGGTIALEMPGPSKKVHTYDAFHFWAKATTPSGNGARNDWYFRWNVMNENDPHDSNGDGIDDDFDENGTPDAEEGGLGYYIASGADGVQTMGSEPFTLNPGEQDTLIFAIVMGDNRNDALNNAKRALALYQNHWEVVKAPPSPTVEVFPGDRKVTLVWGNISEHDPEFEGYKIYRSADNGQTWGANSFKDFDGAVHYIPLAQYDLADSVIGNYRTLPQYAWFFLGEDKWVPVRKVVETDTFQYFDVGDTINMYIDRDVINGLKYRYYIAAYDSGNKIIGPLENTPATNPAAMNNTVEVIPHGNTSQLNLNNVRVVPNPYVVANSWEFGKDHQIQFTHLPIKATIRIVNVACEHVRTIEHDGTTKMAPSIATWDLKNYNNQLVAPGLYFYYIESDVGKTTGKFVIVL